MKRYTGTLECLRDFDAGEQEIRVVEERQTTHYWPIESWLGQISLVKGDIASAEMHLDRVEGPWRRLALAAGVEHARGDTDAAQRSLDELMTRPAGYWSIVAAGAAGIGDSQAAISELKRGLERRHTFVPTIICNRYYNSIRGTTEWQELMLMFGRNADGSQAIPFEMPELPGYDSMAGVD